jgi:2'-hydroxyisoflavone reductase
VRIARGGDVLVPGNGKDFVQIIDARDLAEWVIKMAENNTTGIYNATGPKSELTMGEMVAGIRAAFPGDLDAKFTWVDHEFLTKNQIRGWSHMPVWVAPRPNNDGWSRVSIARAVSKGLTFRPLAVTAKDTLEWNKTRPTAEQLIPKADRLAQGPGIPPEKEAELLAAYRSTKASG